MKKLLVLMLILLASTGWAQNAVHEVPQLELFSTSVCSLGGVSSIHVNNPNYSTDSTFAWSNKISTLIPAPRFKGDESRVFANRAWLTVEIVDTGATGTASNDSLLVFVYNVGPAGGLSTACIDTLCFVMTTGAINRPQTVEISPWHWPPFCNSATQAAATTQVIGDSLITQSSHLPPVMQLKVCGDCSTTTLVPTTPWCNAHDDTIMIVTDLILEYNQSGLPGWGH